MTDTRLMQDMISAGAKLINTQSQPAKPPVDNFSTPKFHKENAVVGESLNDYTDRVPSEDGTYVKVTIHKERIELIEQPPTPEELQAQKDQQKLTFKITAAVAAGVMGLVGLAALLDQKAQRKTRRLEVQTDGR